ncbi:MAG: hypothetical protein JWQ38_3440 [Flavipsychrobacter sp.]|nr:hypothetical protein [Flavipsychrobacter sp.]
MVWFYFHTHKYLCMKDNVKRSIASIAAVMLPLCSFAADNARQFSFTANLISAGNFILLIMAVICIFQYFFRKDEDHNSFHVFNFISVILFYWGSLAFLINHRTFYPGFEHLSPARCVEHLFFAVDIFVIKHWIIALGAILNVLYLAGIRPQPDYYTYGIRQDVE